MITKTIKTTDGKLTLKIPTKIEELHIGQLLELQKDNLSDIEAVAILSYCPLDTLYNIRDIEDIKEFKEPVMELIYSLGFLYNAELIPKTITFTRMNKTVNVVKNLTLEPVGAYMNARDIIATEINKAIGKFGEEYWRDNFKPSTQSCIELLAQYFYCRVTGKTYQEYEVVKFQDEVKYIPVSQALPVVRFFFLKYPHLENQKISSFKLLRMKIQERLALRALKRSARLTRLMP